MNGTNCIYKIETVGEVYMAVCGCPIRVKNHAQLAAAFALDLVDSVKEIKASVNMKNFRTVDGELCCVFFRCEPSANRAETIAV